MHLIDWEMGRTMAIVGVTAGALLTSFDSWGKAAIAFLTIAYLTLKVAYWVRRHIRFNSKEEDDDL